VRDGEKNGVKVFVAAAGMAAHLAGAVAANTTRPVIGVPLAGSALNGMDSLLATVQMPKGVPVATVAIGDHGAINAGFLAAQIIALNDSAVAAKLRERRENH
jgi:5-(carboxyamino)imidazole ribonucleotide mutase